MSELESNRLNDDELEAVNGGGIFTGLIYRNMGRRRREKLFTLEQKGNEDVKLSTLEQENGFPGSGDPFNGFGGTSKL